MIIDKSALAPKLARIKAAVPTSKINDCAQGVLFKDNTITASNEIIAVTAVIPEVASVPFVMPLKAVDMVDNLPEMVFSIDISKGNSLKIVAGKIKNDFQCTPAKDYPVMDQLDEKCQDISIPAGDLLDAISSVMYVVPNDSLKPQHCGVLFDAVGGKINLVACDGYRCAWNQIAYDKDFKFIVPKLAAKCLLSLGITGDVEILFDRRRAVFKSADYTVVTRLLEGEFLDYKAAFPATCDITALVDRSAILGALRRANICNDEKTKRPVILQFDDDTCYVSVKGETAQYSEEILLEDAVGKSITISFNNAYLQDGIKNVVSDKISIGMVEPKAPAVVKGEGDDECFKALVLPVRQEG